jgi:hypothetical protein
MLTKTSGGLNCRRGSRIFYSAPTATATALAPEVAIALEDESMTPAAFVAFCEGGQIEFVNRLF